MSSFSDPPGQGPNAYSSPANFGGPPPKKKSYLWLWLLLGGGALAAVICCGGLGALGMFGLNAASGMLKDELAADPTVVERIGEVQSVEYDIGESMKEAEKKTGNNVAFKVKGAKGEAVVVANSSSGQGLTGAKLRLPSGEEIPLGDKGF